MAKRHETVGDNLLHAVSSCSDAKDSSSNEISLVQISLLQVYFQD